MSWDPIHTAGFTAAGSTTVTLGPYTAKNQQDFRDKKKSLLSLQSTNRCAENTNMQEQ